MILILSQDVAELASMLDDKQLDKQIKAVAQALCDIHYILLSEQKPSNLVELIGNIPLPSKYFYCPFRKWGMECRSNYLKLVEIGLACCDEWVYRFPVQLEDCESYEEAEMYEHKKQSVIMWARDNVPDLPKNEHWKMVDTNRDNALFHPYEEVTPYPHIPKKVYDYWYVNAFYCEDQEIKENATYLAYRDYYRAILQKRKEKKIKHDFCGGTGEGFWEGNNCEGCAGKGYIQKPITWTRRNVPNFLSDLVR